MGASSGSASSAAGAAAGGVAASSTLSDVELAEDVELEPARSMTLGTNVCVSAVVLFLDLL